MPTLLSHVPIALLRLLYGGWRNVSARNVVREIAYVRAQMRWAHMCIEPVGEFETSRQSRTATSPHLPPVSNGNR